jgi:hypothetical protein
LEAGVTGRRFERSYVVGGGAKADSAIVDGRAVGFSVHRGLSKRGPRNLGVQARACGLFEDLGAVGGLRGGVPAEDL